MPYREESAILLGQQIAAGVFPRSLLLTGERYVGRLSLAMEAARVLSCKKGGASTCDCISCRNHVYYGMSNVVFLGNRDHAIRIEAALALMEELSTGNSRRYLLRTVRLMLLQFHPALIDGKDAKSSANFTAASTVSEILYDLEKAPQEEFGEQAQRLRAALKPLYQHLKRHAPMGIGQVRSLQEWTIQTSLTDEPRFIILEGVEESTEGARNSLLKLLEEPPKHTYIMVLSEHPSRLLPTILSRLQRHHVRPLEADMKNRVLADLFATDGKPYESVEEFMLEKASVPCRDITAYAERYADSLIDTSMMPREELDGMCGELDESVRLEYFLKQFQNRIRHRFMAGTCSGHVSSEFMRISDEYARKAFTFNQNGKVLIESLYYRLREMV